MPSPTVDIIVPVWNNQHQARGCLGAILTHSPESRLVIVDNGSDHQTQLMLGEVAEELGERCLLFSTERNLGLVPAINLGLARSDSDYAVIVRPHVTVGARWLEGLLEAAADGMASPLFGGRGAPFPSPFQRGCSCMETFNVSFAVLALKGELHMLLGGFDERLDGDHWCLRDYVSRAASRGYRASVTAGSTVECGGDAVLGSEDRRRERQRLSGELYRERWGADRHFGVYFGRGVTAEGLAERVQVMLAAARRGDRFTLLLHGRQAAEFRRLGWSCLHTSIRPVVLSRFMPRRDLARLFGLYPDMIAVEGTEGALAAAGMDAIPFSGVARDGEP